MCTVVTKTGVFYLQENPGGIIVHFNALSLLLENMKTFCMEDRYPVFSVMFMQN